jgi:hypothetical protein
VELNSGKSDQRQADDAEQQLRGSVPESMGRGFGSVRAKKPSMSFINPAHPSLQSFSDDKKVPLPSNGRSSHLDSINSGLASVASRARAADK